MMDWLDNTGAPRALHLVEAPLRLQWRQNDVVMAEWPVTSHYDLRHHYAEACTRLVRQHGAASGVLDLLWSAQAAFFNRHHALLRTVPRAWAPSLLVPSGAPKALQLLRHVTPAGNPVHQLHLFDPPACPQEVFPVASHAELAAAYGRAVAVFCQRTHAKQEHRQALLEAYRPFRTRFATLLADLPGHVVAPSPSNDVPVPRTWDDLVRATDRDGAGPLTLHIREVEGSDRDTLKGLLEVRHPGLQLAVPLYFLLNEADEAPQAFRQALAYLQGALHLPGPSATWRHQAYERFRQQYLPALQQVGKPLPPAQRVAEPAPRAEITRLADDTERPLLTLPPDPALVREDGSPRALHLTVPGPLESSTVGGFLEVLAPEGAADTGRVFPVRSREQVQAAYLLAIEFLKAQQQLTPLAVIGLNQAFIPFYARYLPQIEQLPSEAPPPRPTRKLAPAADSTLTPWGGTRPFQLPATLPYDADGTPTFVHLACKPVTVMGRVEGLLTIQPPFLPDAVPQVFRVFRQEDLAEVYAKAVARFGDKYDLPAALLDPLARAYAAFHARHSTALSRLPSRDAAATLNAADDDPRSLFRPDGSPRCLNLTPYELARSPYTIARLQVHGSRWGVQQGTSFSVHGQNELAEAYLRALNWLVEKAPTLPADTRDQLEAAYLAFFNRFRDLILQLPPEPVAGAVPQRRRWKDGPILPPPSAQMGDQE